MQDYGKQRETRMMNAVAGLGGRSALSAEVDLRLGLVPALGRLAGTGALSFVTKGLAALWRAMARRIAGPMPRAALQAARR